MTVSTRVLDTRSGRAAAGLPVRLDRYAADTWEPVAEGGTDASGRWTDGGDGDGTPPGTYRLRYGSGAYFAERNEPTCYPEVAIIFTIPDDGRDHHVPLTLGAYAYATSMAF